ncbi:MAG TPA: RraA family protein [Halococcus sp.]|nr:RraA family protein [Halococcus sp.]
MTTDDGPLDRTLFDRLERLSTPAVADTKHDGVSVLTPAIESVHADCTVTGAVRTVKLDPSALWAPVQTLDEARSGEVIVVDTGGCTDEAIWGELLSTYATAIGVVGMVTNGAVRDIAGIRDLGFPAFARTRTPRGPSGSEEVETNVQVIMGEALIDPGDVLVGDESGVVVIDRDTVDEVITAAEAVAETERAVERQIEEGGSLGDAFESAGMG